jgi:geranylgeranyl diphosphate synthase type II
VINRDHAAKVSHVTELYNLYEVREKATEIMKEYLDKAFSALEEINVPDQNKKELMLLANQLMNREY